jgi:uncharacterized protein with FMN-binding domain
MHIVIILFVAVVLGVAGTLYYKQPAEEPGLQLISASGDAVVETPVQEAPEEEPVAAPDGYKDGTYEAVGTYTSPAAPEDVKVSVTLKDNIVTAATFEGEAKNPASVQNQEKFNEGYTALVVGKPLDSIDLTVVNGSSLTPRGFMDALRDIKMEARI